MAKDTKPLNDAELKELLNIIEKCKMDKNDVIREAELVEEYGEWYHMSLMGYSETELRQAADAMTV